MGPHLTVRDYMTEAPHSLGIDQTLRDAERAMKTLGVRHLPVLEDGVLRGVVTDRDLALWLSLKVESAQDVSVAQVMSLEPYSVSARAPLSRVAEAMLAHKYGCAVVMDGPRVQGIFTTTDALRALLDLLAERALPEDTMPPAQVRSVVLSEHVHLRSLIDLTESAAVSILKAGACGHTDLQLLRERTRQLLTAMAAHLELENRVLVPAMRKVDGFGVVRAEQLLSEHASQHRAWDAMIGQLDDPNQAPVEIAASVARLVQDLRNDMVAEEESLLNAEILRDEMICTDAVGG